MTLSNPALTAAMASRMLTSWLVCPPSDIERLEAIRAHADGTMRYYATAFLRETDENRDLMQAYMGITANILALLDGDALDDRSMMREREEIIQQYIAQARSDPDEPGNCSFCGERPVAAWFEGPTFRTFVRSSADTGVTLRQAFYRLVADGTIVNTLSSYNRLARLSAEARRDGWFPSLIDGTRHIRRPLYFDSPQDVRNWLRGENGYDEPAYRIDRTQGQSHRVLIAAEKSTLEAQLIAWYDERGISVAALRGYGSTPLLDQIDAEDFDVILYVGDFDPTGEDIERVLAERLNGGAEITRVAVTPDQVTTYNPPPMPGKATDPRAPGFTSRHGRLVQVEVEALDPNDLRALLDITLSSYWDEDAYGAVVEREERERATL